MLNKLIVCLSLACCLMSCSSNTPSEKSNTDESNTTSETTTYVADIANGKKLFEATCKLCHGIDGKLGLNGAKDLTQSAMDLDEMIHIIKKGKNVMTPFEGILTGKEILDVATYVKDLKK